MASRPPVKTKTITRNKLAEIARDHETVKFLENLGQDVSQTLPDAISGVVQGPPAAVDGNIAVYDGTSGDRLKDGGIHLDEVALLDSPAFTGVPTAPTAAPSTSTDQIATTAFVDSGYVNDPFTTPGDMLYSPDGSTADRVPIGVDGQLLTVVAGVPAWQPAADGGLVFGQWNFATNTAPPPGNGSYRLNNASLAAVTAAFIDYDSATGSDVSNFLKLIIQEGERLIFQEKDNAARYAMYTVTGPVVDGGTYVTVPLAHVQDGGLAFNAGRYLIVNAGRAATTPAYFSAYATGSQSIPSATVTKVAFNAEQFDIGNAFASSRWTPPGGRPVTICGGVLIDTAAGQTTTLAVFKNGVEFKRGNQVTASTAFANACVVSCMDVPNGTDFYELFITQDSGGAQNTAGTAPFTYFQGSTITP